MVKAIGHSQPTIWTPSTLHRSYGVPGRVSSASKTLYPYRTTPLLTSATVQAREGEGLCDSNLPCDPLVVTPNGNNKP